MNIIRVITLLAFVAANISFAYSAGCIVGGTDFDTPTTLFNPTLTNDEDGWFNEDVGDLLDAQCGGNCSYSAGVNNAIHKGMSSNVMNANGSLTVDFDDYKTKNVGSSDIGFVGVVANPRTISPYLNEGSGSNMLVCIGNGNNAPFYTYTVKGLKPNSTVTLSADIYNLISLDNMEKALTIMDDGTTRMKITNGVEFVLETVNGAKKGVIYANPKQITVSTATQNNNQQPVTSDLQGSTWDKTSLNWGEKDPINITKAKADENGVVTFYFFRSEAAFDPIAIDNIKIEGEIKPEIKASGNPCPANPFNIRLGATYPSTATYKWIVAEDATQTSNKPTLSFIPAAEGTYNVTCEVTLSSGCTFKSDVFKVTTSDNCCKNGDVNLALVDIYRNDFGYFAGNNYYYTDNKGVEHSVPVTDQLNGSYGPAIEDQQGGGDAVQFPYNKDIWAGGYAVGTQDPYGGSGGDFTGNAGGGMLVMDIKNGGWNGKAIYKQEIKNLCKSKPITVGAVFKCINTPQDGPTVGTLEMRLTNAAGQIIEDEGGNPITTGPKVLKDPMKWEGFLTPQKFTLASDETSVFLQIISLEDDYSGSGRGDFALDDIVFQVCAPPDIDVASNLTAKELLDLCTDKSFTLSATLSEQSKKYYPNIRYWFQYATKNPSTTPDDEMDWTPLTEEADEKDSYTFTVPKEEEPFKSMASNGTNTNLYFRVVVGDKSTLDDPTQAWKKLSATSPCRNISISSIPIIASLNCAKCVKADEPKFTYSVSNKALTDTEWGGLTKSVSGKIELCPGEIAHIKASDIKEIENTTTRPDGKTGPRTYNATWHKGDKNAAPTAGIGYTEGDTEAKIDITYENAGKYYLVLQDADYTEHDCDVEFEIEVVANEKPTETLTAPAAFCEGSSLATAPELTKTGYTVNWYSDTNGTTALTSAPTQTSIEALTADKTYYYTLTNNTTNCVSDVKEYEIKVVSLPTNPIADESKIEYLKSEGFINNTPTPLKPLNEKGTAVFKSTIYSADYKVMVGQVTGATTSTKPSLSTSNQGTAGEVNPPTQNAPIPTIANASSTNDEYLWYYTYTVTTDAPYCESPRTLIEVIIKGAPSPSTTEAKYCVNSPNVKPLSKRATVSTDEPTGTLKFYDKDEETEISGTTLPDVSTPGLHTYYVSQVGAGGESSKQEIKITVYGVEDVKLSEASHTYCKDATSTPLESIASADSPAREYYKHDESGSKPVFEFFKNPTNAEIADLNANKAVSGGATTMEVQTSSATETNPETPDDYYARLKYTVSATEVCYGDAKKYPVTVIDVQKPTGSGSITYLKDEGDPSKGNSFALPLTQDKNNNGGTMTAVMYDDTKYDLIWYNASGSEKTEADAKPNWNDIKNLTGNDSKTFYVNLKLKDAPHCESEKTPVQIIVSGYPTPSVQPIEVCEGDLSGKLEATANKVNGGDDADKFDVVWYKAKDDGTIDESEELARGQKTSGIDLSPTAQTAKAGQAVTVYKYFVLQQLRNNASAKSAPVSVTVTVHAKPKLELKESIAPICGKVGGETTSKFVDLETTFNETTNPSESLTYEYKNASNTTITNKKVNEAGDYSVTASFKVGTADCVSEPLTLPVVVHELDATITGSPKTCPGESVELTGKAITAGGVMTNSITYSWSNDINSATGNKAVYETTGDGLTTGTTLTATLTVEAGACKGTEAMAVTHEIEVGDGPLEGTITFTEDKNAESGYSKDVSDNDIVFLSCGKKSKVTIDVTATDDDFSYTKDGGAKQTGSFASNKTITLEPGEYEFFYKNKCNTSFKFTIKDVSTSVQTASKTKLTICEQESFTATISVTPKTAGFPYEIKWYHGEDNTGTELTAFKDNETLSITNATVSDKGFYAYEVISGGCVSTDEITGGLSLIVKPYIKIDRASMKREYEQIRDEELTMSIPFTIPSSTTDIENDIKWNDLNTSETLIGSSQNITVTQDHEYIIEVNSSDYCPDTTRIKVYVEAKLMASAELDVDKMCVGENHKITVDTTGTGKVLHPDRLTIKVEETTASGTRTINLLRNGKMLDATISPKEDATYTVTYKYDSGKTDQQTVPVPNLPLQVFPAFSVKWEPTNAEICEGGQVEITITECKPDGTTLKWEDNNDISASTLGATITPKFTATTGFSQRKSYTLTAENGICKPATFYPALTVDLPIEGTISAPEYICEKTDLTLDASSFNAQEYKWYSDEQLGENVYLTSPVIKVMPKPEYATYMLDVVRGACTFTTEHSVVVTPAPKIDKVDSLSYRQVEIVLESGTGTPPFMYIIDGDTKAEDVLSAVKEDLEYGKHTVKVIDGAGCEVTHKFIVNTPDISIPKMISPNGDGIGDIFKIGVLSEAYPDANVTIFDRWGKKVAVYKAGDSQGWDGTYNGNPLPSTDYWYEVEIKELEKTYVGHFSLIRQ